MGKNDVTALTLSLTVEVDATVLYLPLARHIALAITTPSGKGLTIEDSDKAFLVNGQFMTVPQLRSLKALRTNDCHSRTPSPLPLHGECGMYHTYRKEQY
jgi:hypothetical protein